MKFTFPNYAISGMNHGPCRMEYITYKLRLPNIDAISGAHITLSLILLAPPSQYEEGARDGIDFWYMKIII